MHFTTGTEALLLGMLLKNPGLTYELKYIKSFMFSSTPNTILFSSIEELLDQGLIPEVSLIDAYLQSQKRYDTVGGREYLNYLEKQTSAEENLREYERIIVDSYKARVLTQMSAELPDLISKSSDMEHVLNNIRTTLDTLGDSSGGQSTEQMKSILKSSWDIIVERVQNPGIQGFSTGLSKIDTATGGMIGGDLWFLASRPSMGKSAVACNWMLNQGMGGIPTLFFSLEMSKALIMERLLSTYTKIPLSNLRLGLLNQGNMDLISSAMRDMKDYPIYIDPLFDSNINYVTTTIRRYVKLHGIKIVYLDYIQLLADRGNNATHDLGAISRKLKLLAHELDITIIILSQLNRGVELRDNKRPMIADMRQSGYLEEDADIIIGLYRDEKYTPDSKFKGLMENIILKQRSGPTGTVFTKFDDTTVSVRD